MAQFQNSSVSAMLKATRFKILKYCDNLNRARHIYLCPPLTCNRTHRNTNLTCQDIKLAMQCLHPGQVESDPNRESRQSGAVMFDVKGTFPIAMRYTNVCLAITENSHLYGCGDDIQLLLGVEIIHI